MPVSPLPGVVARLRAAGCVFAEDEAQLLVSAAGTPDELDAMIQRRADGLPLEYVLGWAEFCGLRMAVDPGVFIPAGAPSSWSAWRPPAPGRPPARRAGGQSCSTCAAAQARWGPRWPPR